MKKLIFSIMLIFCFSLAYGQTRFKHILITNDDGIEDADRLAALAKGLQDSADRISIIVPAFDRSGTSNHSAYGKYRSVLEITCRYVDKKNNIAAYTLPANPADCVLLGLGGFFGEDRPDLVLSGINGGPNIGPGWFGSGTIGAARSAAFLGVKAIAFSGFDDNNKESFSVIPGWINKFISSGVIEAMDKNSYLTVGFPRIPFEKIKGVRLAERRVSFDRPELFRFGKIYGKEPHVPDNKTIWSLEPTGNPSNLEIKQDDYYLRQGFVIITPMTIDENNRTLMQNIRKKLDLIPDFPKSGERE